MTGEEWLEIMGWVNERFKPGWTADQGVAYGTDLRDFNAEDVWDALQRLYSTGLEFAPNGSQLRKETAVVVRERLVRAQQEARGLPPAASEGQGWSDWAARLGHEGLSVAEASKVRHGQLFPRGCPYPECDVCGNVLTSHPSV